MSRPPIRIPLSKGHVALVDAEDAESVNQYNWYATSRKKGVFAMRTLRRADGKKSSQLLHTFLTGYQVTEHENGNTLDNRRVNLKEGSASRPALGRFSEKTIQRANGCIEWTGANNGAGYGQFFIDWQSGRNLSVLAHRWAYEYHIGPIPDGLSLDHLCRNTMCVNPAHLEPVTHQENTLRGVGVSAVHARKTSCINGHPFSGENLILRTNGKWRECRQCRRDRDRANRAKKKELNAA